RAGDGDIVDGLDSAQLNSVAHPRHIHSHKWRERSDAGFLNSDNSLWATKVFREKVGSSQQPDDLAETQCSNREVVTANAKDRQTKNSTSHHGYQHSDRHR